MAGTIDSSPVTTDLAAVPQSVGAPLTRAAIFLVVTVNPGAEAETAVRGLCADLAGLLRSVGFRGPDERLSGTFDGLEADGAMRLRLADGQTEIVRVGDVTFS